MLRLADMNGDGLADIVYTGANDCCEVNNQVRVMLNTGTAFADDIVWGEKNKSGRYDLVDLDGDGLSDVVYNGRTSSGS